jgi:CRISPR type III-A-associated RAMP protein Csm4
MRHIVLLRCKPQSRFHLGETTEIRSNTLTDTSTYIHSDVLFGAFLSQLSQLYPGRVEDFISYFQEDMVAFSSAFYCLEVVGHNQHIFFLPKPVSLNLIEVKDEQKKLKKIQFLSWQVWEKQYLPHQWFDSNICHIIDGKFVVSAQEMTEQEAKRLRVYAKDDALKVRRHTTEVENNLYSQTDLFLLGNEHYQVHWYFLEENKLPQANQAIYQQVWQTLAQTGLGGERSTGAGQFEAVEFGQHLPEYFSLDTPQRMSLSLVFPTEEDIHPDQLLLYQMKVRGGMFLSQDARLKAIQGILEGAVHTSVVKGSIVELSTKRLRYGKCFSIALPSSYQIVPSSS